MPAGAASTSAPSCSTKSPGSASTSASTRPSGVSTRARTLAVAQEDHSWRLAAGAIVLATGATENGLSFPGWTLPGVMGAGCVQTMINVHRVLPGSACSWSAPATSG